MLNFIECWTVQNTDMYGMMKGMECWTLDFGRCRSVWRAEVCGMLNFIECWSVWSGEMCRTQKCKEYWCVQNTEGSGLNWIVWNSEGYRILMYTENNVCWIQRTVNWSILKIQVYMMMNFPDNWSKDWRVVLRCTGYMEPYWRVWNTEECTW